jgi:hypothetical protein
MRSKAPMKQSGCTGGDFRNPLTGFFLVKSFEDLHLAFVRIGQTKAMGI